MSSEKTCNFFMSSEKTCLFFHNLKNLSVFHTLENTCNYSRSQNFFNIFSNYLSLDNVVNTCNIHYLIMNPIRPVFHIMPNYITCECCALEFGEYQTFDKPLLSIQLQGLIFKDFQGTTALTLLQVIWDLFFRHLMFRQLHKHLLWRSSLF